MRPYTRQFKEALSKGTVQVEDADCNDSPRLKNIILQEYEKLTGKNASELQAWNRIPHRYDILPEDYELQSANMDKAVKSMGSGTSFGMVWDTVDVILLLSNSKLLLHFKGFKLDKFVKVKF